MSSYQEYSDIFDKEIVQKSKGIIFSFSPLNDQYTYRPYSHGLSNDAVEKLGELMRHNLFFYSFGEDEVVDYYKQGKLLSIEQAAKYAYKSRLPHRAGIQDGLPSEVLLDLLVQLYDPTAYKLAVRTIFRQDDNNEIKGYDLTYFSKDESGISLWLGQAKLGEKAYCKNGINTDLLKKYVSKYLAKQLYFVSSKRVLITEDAQAILEAIDTLNIRTIDEDDDIRAKELLILLNKLDIKIKIPCLLAYEEGSVYKDSSKLYERIITEVEGIRDFFNNHPYTFTGFSPEIVFYVFPIQSVKRLRDEENGFYAGLC
ncbi:hypothetical protein [uncultured Neglectibacter sp.]|mgnify:CR=1 FL=1|uniref:Hachiman antiphage defense system protein HamA n=1 Tax=uncultured Neglectibacter sp. TaxID=1924108 RepID=UPI0034DDF060